MPSDPGEGQAGFRFYRVHFYSHVEGSEGFLWCTSRKRAEREMRKYKSSAKEPAPTVEEVNIEPTKRGITGALNSYASHNDNG